MSGNTSLLRSSGGMAAGTVVSRATGFIRNLVVIQVIGLLVFADTYSVANTIPNILYILLLGGMLNAVFIPALVRAREHDEDGGEAYAQRLLTLGTIVLLVITVASVIAAPLLMRLYATAKWTPTDLQVSIIFAYYLLPQIFFYGLYNLLSQVLNVRGRFGPMMWTPVMNNIVVMAVAGAFLLLYPDWNSDAANLTATVTPTQIALLGLGTTAGVVLQALLLLPVLRKTGFRMRFRGQFRKLGLRHLGKLGGWSLVFVFINQVAYWLITRMATAVGKLADETGIEAGSYTAYSTAHLIFMLPHSIVAVSLVTALMPRMSAHVLAKRFDEVRADVGSTLRMVAVVTIPAAMAFLVLGQSIAQVLYPGVRSATQAGLILSAFALGLVAFSAQYLALRGFYALEDTRTPAMLQLGIATINVVGALAAYQWLPLEWKLPGIAVAYSVSYIVGLQLSLRILSRRFDGIEGARTLRTWVQLTVAAVVAGVVAWGVSFGVKAALGGGYGATAVGLFAALTAGGLVYLLIVHFMRVREVQMVVSVVRAKLRR